MKCYMLDTNIVSYLCKAHPIVTRRVIEAPISSVCISAITEGELLYGLAKRPEAKQLHQVVREFLRRVDVFPWDSSAAECYGAVRAEMSRKGKIIAPLDLLIATHALTIDATLVTNDQALAQITNLCTEDWSI